VTAERFREHLQTLGEVVDLVALDEFVARDSTRDATPARWRRPAVALTFDDDLPSHAEQALPALRDFDVPAAFFLSGRALQNRGPYWFQQLEVLLEVHGQSRTASLLHVPGGEADTLVRLCEEDAAVRRQVSDLARALPVPCVLARDGISRLARAGMTIGFHTVDHPILPSLDDAALRDSLSRGRADLAAAAGAAVRYFAYPHGKADARCAAAVQAAGFDAGFTGFPHPFRPGDDLLRIGRWEPGSLTVDDLLVSLAVRLHRSAPRRPQRPL
jgi:peptidoglycan/xylan/chitin deacetylase (PgdA/CDA1 family)